MLIIRCLILTILCVAFNSKIHAASVIADIPPAGIVITAPGTYVFEKDLTWNPTGDGQAILIIANNVTIDMKHHKLESALTQFNTIGILALASSNVTIKNGTIAHMALGGVKCDLCNHVTVKHVTVDGLNRQNTAVFTVPVGILGSLSSNVLVEKCTVQNVDVRTGSLVGIQMTGTTSSKISKCNVCNLINRDGVCSGIGHIVCDLVEVSECRIEKLTSEFIDNLNTEGHTAIGIIPTLSTNIKIEKCKVKNITGCCDDAHGISVFECLNAIVRKCTVDTVLDGAGLAQTGAKATGIEVYASGVKVSDCTVKNISAINPQDRQATGFSCAQCTGVEFFRCIAENVNVYDAMGRHDTSLGYGTGFGWAPDPRIIAPAVGTFYKYCTAKKCQVGFDSWFHIDSVWEDIFSDRNDIAVLDLFQPPRTLSCDPCSECGCLFPGCYPTPFSITLDNVAANNVFIRVSRSCCRH